VAPEGVSEDSIISDSNVFGTGTSGPLSPVLLNKMDAYWRAANYLTVGQNYLQDSPCTL
jgi:phosphoketolase